MPFQTSLLANDAYNFLRGQMPQLKANAQQALASCQAGSIDSDQVFRLLDVLHVAISNIATDVAVSGLDAYANSVGYTGSIVSDSNATSNAATSCINWISANFPISSGGWLQDRTMNADGTRNVRQFTNTQTAGLQTALQNLIATIQ